ncbi:MAG: hypothetical protein RLY16_1555 [Bacteroidota bacterium]|jgi:hypothetical protein
MAMDKSNFDLFYANQLQPFFQSLQAESHQAKRYLRAALLCLIGCLLFGIGYITDTISSYSLLVAILFGITAIGNASIFYEKRSSFQQQFKSKIIRRIIEHIQSDLTYDPEGSISSKDYQWSSLYRIKYDYFEGEDLIAGNYKGVPFTCCELHTVNDNEYSKFHGTCFKGMFFKAPIHPLYQAGTYIWLRNQEQLPVSIADEEYRMYPMPTVHPIRFQHPTFENIYSVYGSDTTEAYHLLTEERMNRIIAFMQTIQKPISFSFVAGNCYVAMPFKENLFEPYHHDIANREVVKSYFTTILLMLSIIPALQLDQLQQTPH